jgi:hypothetical protein
LKDYRPHDFLLGADEFNHEFRGLAVSRLYAGFESLEPLVEIGSHFREVPASSSLRLNRRRKTSTSVFNQVIAGGHAA